MLYSLSKELSCNTVSTTPFLVSKCVSQCGQMLSMSTSETLIWSFFFNQTNEFLAMTNEQRTKLKWQFLLERSKIYLKVSIFKVVVFYINSSSKKIFMGIFLFRAEAKTKARSYAKQVVYHQAAPHPAQECVAINNSQFQMCKRFWLSWKQWK